MRSIGSWLYRWKTLLWRQGGDIICSQWKEWRGLGIADKYYQVKKEAQCVQRLTYKRKWDAAEFDAAEACGG